MTLTIELSEDELNLLLVMLDRALDDLGGSGEEEDEAIAYPLIDRIRVALGEEPYGSSDDNEDL